MKLKELIDDVCGEPSLDHLNAKLFVWFLSAALVGLVLASVLTGYDDDDKMLRNQRPSRSIRITRAYQLRGLRRRAA